MEGELEQTRNQITMLSPRSRQAHLSPRAQRRLKAESPVIEVVDNNLVRLATPRLLILENTVHSNIKFCFLSFFLWAQVQDMEQMLVKVGDSPFQCSALILSVFERHSLCVSYSTHTYYSCTSRWKRFRKLSEPSRTSWTNWRKISQSGGPGKTRKEFRIRKPCNGTLPRTIIDYGR